LDRPNTRPATVSSPGLKLAHGKTLSYSSVSPRVENPSLVIDSILYRTLFALRLSVSRCSLKFHRFIYYVTHYTVFFHLLLASLMTKSNEIRDCGESEGNAGEEMPAGFGLPTATFIVIAGMVGTGILTTSGFTVLDVGSNQWMLLLWILGGITAICGALTVAELSTALPKTGGDYVYLYEAYGPLPAFLSGWVSFLIGFAVPSAASAFAFANYIIAPLKLPGTKSIYLEQALATAAVLVFAVVHISGRLHTARVQGTITCLKICGLLAFVCAGLSIGWRNSANLRDFRPVDATLASSLMSSMVYVYYAYTGWNSAAYVAGEVRDPQRRLPWAILLGTAGVTALYLALNVVYGLALSAADVRAIVADPSNDIGRNAVVPIAQIAAARLFGQQWSTVFSIAFGTMLLSTLSAYILIGPRVVYAMARAGHFPTIAARLSRRAGTPVVATALQAGMTLFLLWTGSFENLIIYAGVGLSIFAMLVVSSIYVLRWKRPDMVRPFRTPGYPATPAVFLIVTGLLTAATAHEHPRVSLYAVLSILAGVPLYYIWQDHGRFLDALRQSSKLNQSESTKNE
jgi:basic amino acid/polyamine antiporter, APA family